MDFNVNHYVRVKLTDYGRECLRKNHEQLYQGWKGTRPEYHPPNEDVDGWSRWQLWSLMADLGPHISLGMNPPFEATIQIETETVQ